MADQGDAVTEVLVELRALNEALDRMHGDIGDEMQMNGTDLRALQMLVIREQRGQSVSPHELASHLRISTASTTKLVDRLSAAGHVERHPHPHDGRARVLVLTPHSRRIFAQHFGSRLGEMRAVASDFSEDELRIVSLFLGKTARALSAD